MSTLKLVRWMQSEDCSEIRVTSSGKTWHRTGAVAVRAVLMRSKKKHPTSIAPQQKEPSTRRPPRGPVVGVMVRSFGDADRPWEN
jgi:hypothetical protein